MSYYDTFLIYRNPLKGSYNPSKGRQTMDNIALIFSVLSFTFSIINFIELRAQRLSTHQVQYVDPLKDWENELESANKESKENNDLDNVY